MELQKSLHHEDLHGIPNSKEELKGDMSGETALTEEEDTSEHNNAEDISSETVENLEGEEGEKITIKTTTRVHKEGTKTKTTKNTKITTRRKVMVEGEEVIIGNEQPIEEELPEPKNIIKDQLPSLDLFRLQQNFLSKKYHKNQHQLLALVSLYGQANSRESMTYQNRAITFLQGALGKEMQERYIQVDASSSDPLVEAQRDALLEISKAGPVYPQFFLVQKRNKQQDAPPDSSSTSAIGGGLDEMYSSIKFFGNYNDLFQANEQNILRSSFLQRKSLVAGVDGIIMKDDEDWVVENEQEDQQQSDIIDDTSLDQQSTEDDEMEQSPDEQQVDEDKEAQKQAANDEFVARVMAAQKRLSTQDFALAKEVIEEDSNQTTISDNLSQPVEDESPVEEVTVTVEDTTKEEDGRPQHRKDEDDAFAARVLAAQKAAEGGRNDAASDVSSEDEGRPQYKKDADDAFAARVLAAQKAEEGRNDSTAVVTSEEEEGRPQYKKDADDAFAARVLAAQKAAEGGNDAASDDTTEDEGRPQYKKEADDAFAARVLAAQKAAEGGRNDPASSEEGLESDADDEEEKRKRKQEANDAFAARVLAAQKKAQEEQEKLQSS